MPPEAPPAEPEAPPEPEDDGPQLFDFETDAGPIEPVPAEEPLPPEDDFDALGPADEEGPYLEEEEPYAPEPALGAEAPPEEAYEGGEAEPEEYYEEELQEETGEADLLSRPPEFADEDDDEEGLWFEKGPPQDFDFEDDR
jgi:hypothetical protein